MRRALLACAALLAASPTFAQQYSGYQPGPGPQPSTGGGGGSGTVTSAGLALPSSLFTVTGSPVTTSGTLTGTLKTQLPNIVWAGPTTGAAAAPTFRALVGADLPNPGASSLGGVNSKAAVSHNFLTQIGTDGSVTAAQPVCADLSNAGVFCPASAGAGVITAVGVNVGSAGAFVVNGGALGTPSSGTLTSATGLPISTGVSGLGANVATFLATPTSANLAAAVTDGTGSGANVFAASPTLVTPVLGAASLTSATFGTSGVFQDAANILGVHNGANAQTLRACNTYTDNSNYECGVIDWKTTANTLTIGTQAAGTGSVRDLRVVAGSKVATLAAVTGLFSLPGAFSIGGGGTLAFGINGKESAPTDGVLTLQNNAQTGFTRLQLGGTTSSFPALKVSSTSLEVRLADDSADTNIIALSQTLTGVTVSALGTPTAGTLAYITDANAACVAGTTPTGGGSTKCFVGYNGAAWKEFGI